MTLDEYIESFGWKREELTEGELREVRREMKAKEAGLIVLDGVLFHKPRVPKN